MSSVHPPYAAVEAAVDAALMEDLGGGVDVTSLLVPSGVMARGVMVARAPGVLAGRMCADSAFARVDGSVVVAWCCDDGDEVVPGTVIAEVEGPLRSILTAERTALNFLCHLSGVATQTRRFVDALRSSGSEARIRDTRKTLPGLRALQKAAVRAGGGSNHRSGLYDAFLLKDNHIAGVSITAAVSRARETFPDIPLEVECDREDQVAEAVSAGATLVLLDNMDPEQVSACATIAHAAGAVVEVSGGVGLESVGAYAAAGADMISVGSITHSAPVLDIALDISTGVEGG